MKLLYGIIGLLLVLTLVVACTMEKNTNPSHSDDLDGLSDVDALDAELGSDLDTAELDQLIDDLDSY